MQTRTTLAVLTLTALTTAAAQAAVPTWTSYPIRNAGDGTAPTINDPYSYGGHDDAVQIITNLGSQKAAIGTNSINGSTIGDITHAAIDRLDNYTRFATNSGGHYGPYMNIWVKDGNGKYAVLANEPSNVEWSGTSEWDTTGSNLATKTIKVFEVESGFELPTGVTLSANGLTNGTFADFADYVIDAPASHPWAGTGAPGAYGFNWVFGDTGANYTTDTTGYIVANPLVAVPEPTTLALVGLAGVGLLRRRRQA